MLLRLNIGHLPCHVAITIFNHDEHY